ncbi:Bug family tripartite tricarboxylate transporter substrate binding protein [Variovorax sp. ZT5P49]|uniref:Bug family tripartite tricarboxylate transporter substrate binding protein n=1 Tax=Variovorax sp. ZT5P49 TaxID=3443733 RepID=UPI003F4595D6
MTVTASKRAFIKRSAALVALPLWVPLRAAAQESDFPTKPVRIIVGYPPGQTVDSAARAMAIALAEILGKPVFVDNKAGANGILGAQELKQAAPDGHTLLLGTSGQLAINPGLYKRLPYDPLKEFAPVTLSGIGRLYIVVPAASPFKTLDDLVQYAKAHPGKLNYGSGGRGITANLAMEMFKKEAGIDILHVPYKGSASALTDLMGGQIDVMMDAGGLVLPQIKLGKLRALGVSSTSRYSEMPALKTVAEQGYPGFEAAAWTGVVAPANTPPAVIQKLNKALLQAQSRPDVIASAKASSSEMSGGTPEEFRKFLVDETRKWGAAAKAAGVEME